MNLKASEKPLTKEELKKWTSEIEEVLSMYKEITDDISRTGHELMKTNKPENVLIAIAMSCLDWVGTIPTGAVVAAKALISKRETDKAKS